jgi:hypothetical protein
MNKYETPRTYARKLLAEAASIAHGSWGAVAGAAFDCDPARFRLHAISRAAGVNEPTIERIQQVIGITHAKLKGYDDPTPQEVDDFVIAVTRRFLEVKRQGKKDWRLAG